MEFHQIPKSQCPELAFDAEYHIPLPNGGWFINVQEYENGRPIKWSDWRTFKVTSGIGITFVRTGCAFLNKRNGSYFYFKDSSDNFFSYIDTYGNFTDDREEAVISDEYYSNINTNTSLIIPSLDQEELNLGKYIEFLKIHFSLEKISLLLCNEKSKQTKIMHFDEEVLGAKLSYDGNTILLTFPDKVAIIDNPLGP